MLLALPPIKEDDLTSIFKVFLAKVTIKIKKKT
jgi:hypothetical protein